MSKRPQTRLVLTAVGLVAALALALVMASVDPWAWWAGVRARVQAETGLELTSATGPGLTLFPSPGITLTGVTLADPAPGGPPVVACARVEVRPRLIPLFQRRLELDLIRLDGLRLDLTRAGPGRRPRVVAPGPAAEPSAGPAAPEAARLADPSTATPAQVALTELSSTLLRGARVEAVDAAVTWTDAAAGPDLLDLTIDIGPIDPAAPWALRLAGRLTPRGHGDAGIWGARRGALVAATAALDPGAWATPAPILALGEVRILVADPAAPAVEPLELTGSLGLRPPQEPGQRPAVRFDLAANRLDLLPAQAPAPGPDPVRQAPVAKPVTVAGPGVPALPAPSSAPAPEPAPQPAQPQLPQPQPSPPYAWLRDLDLDGTLSVQQLQVARLRLAQVSLQIRGDGGDLYLDHRAGDFYGGGLAGTLHLDLRGQDPQVDLAGAALGFQAEPLLTDLTGAAALRGRGDLTVKLATTGRDRDALVRGLGGSLALVLRDGALSGLDLSPLIAAAGSRPPTGQPPPFTSFTELRANAVLTNGLLRNEDLIATGPWMRLTGGGTLDLNDGRLDWRLAPILNAPPQGGGIKELEGVPIPVYLGGNLGDPTWRVDVAAVLREVARRRLEDRHGDVIEQLERRTGVKGLDGVLRGLLGR